MNKSCHWQARLLEFSKLTPTVTQRKIMQMVAYVPQDSQHRGPVGFMDLVPFSDAGGYVERSGGFKKGREHRQVGWGIPQLLLEPVIN